MKSANEKLNKSPIDQSDFNFQCANVKSGKSIVNNFNGVKVINDRSGITVEIIPKAFGNDATILGLGFALNVPPNTLVKISSARFWLKHDKAFDAYYLHWDWHMRADKVKQGNGLGSCNITDIDFLELKNHFEEIV